MNRSILLFLATCTLVAVRTNLSAEPPNLVIILADDLGYGDLGCYGSKRNETHHLDRLAKEGLRFTDFHSNGPMCSPTRTALLTGLYQNRFGRRFESALSGRAGKGNGLPLEAVTLAEALKKVGYSTGCFGKWHLGYEPAFFPTRQGFDEYRGLVTGDGDHHTQIDRSGYEDWWQNEKVIREKGYTTDLITHHGIRFMETNRDRPFFLYLSHLAIHFPWQGPKDPPHRTKGKGWHKDKWGNIPNRGNISPHTKAMIESLDRSVGKTMAAIKRLGLGKNTFVFFCSDNGGYLNYRGGFENISSNGVLRGQKTQVYEGGHRVPAIAWWPDRIKPGVSHHTAATFDLFPTLTALAKAEEPARLDGINLAPILFAQESLEPRTLFWRMGDSRAVRQGRWKLIAEGNKPAALYNLKNDIGEKLDLAASRLLLTEKLSKTLRKWEMEMDRGF